MTAMYGEQGRDTMNGGSGDDEMYGGEDKDILNGGEGDDLAGRWPRRRHLRIRTRQRE